MILRGRDGARAMRGKRVLSGERCVGEVKKIHTLLILKNVFGSSWKMIGAACQDIISYFSL